MKREFVECQFVGDANTKNGRVVRCPHEGIVAMRLRGIEQIVLGHKPVVCQDHMQLMLSAKVRATGRDWQIDHFLSEKRRAG